mmetsp:Transcript_13784/g.38080  ORF Transcript_13784/g.38080 Transcript_13784/m.38080 type:complete len:96 (-) Transcript_13784:568-855(-)
MKLIVAMVVHVTSSKTQKQQHHSIFMNALNHWLNLSRCAPKLPPHTVLQPPSLCNEIFVLPLSSTRQAPTGLGACFNSFSRILLFSIRSTFSILF